MRTKRSCVWLSCILACGVCLAAVWLYWPSLVQPFHFDDQLFLRDDNIRLGRWQAFVFPPVSRVLTWMTFLIQYQTHGSSPTGYHAFNLILHALNSVLVFALLSLLLARPPGGSGAGAAKGYPLLAAAIGASVFALHPVQTETVLMVYQRSTLLAAFFGFSSLLCRILAKRLGERGGFPDRNVLDVLAVSFFLLALTAKESAVVVPLLFWVLDGLFERRWRPAPRLALLLTMGGVAGLAMAMAGAETGQVVTSQGLSGVFSYAASQVRVVWLYFGLILGLVPLNIDHQVQVQTGARDPIWWLALAGLALLLWGMWRARFRHAALAFFGLAFFLFLLPSSSFLPSPDLAFEHRVYASMLGVAGLVAVIAVALSRRLAESTGSRISRSRSILAALVLAACAGLVLVAGSTRRRIADWNDPIRLWRDTVAKSPDKYRPNFNLGVLLLENRPAEADRFLSRAIEIDPSQPLAYRSLGEARLREGSTDDAERLWRQALLLAPNDFDTLLALGKLDRQRRRYFEAKSGLEAAGRVRPDDWEVHYQLGMLQLDFGFVSESIPQLERALELSPSRPVLHYALAEPMTRTGNWERAIQLYRGGLALAPDDASAHYRLALIYRQAGRTEEARAEVEKGMAVGGARPRR